MSICNLDENKELAADIAAYIELSIQESLESGKVFKLFPIFKTMFDAINEADKDPIKAAGVAAIVPQMFTKVVENNPSLLTSLISKNIANIDSIKAIKVLEEEIRVSPNPIDLVISKIEKRGLTLSQLKNNQLNPEKPEGQTIPKYIEDYGIIKERALRALTYKQTTGKSQQQVGDAVATVTKSDADKYTSYRALQNILVNHNPKNRYEDDTIDGHTGFRLAAVTEGQLPNPEKNVYNTNKKSTALVQAIVDSNGNYLYFDEEGSVTTKEKGKIAYFPFRSTSSITIQTMVSEGLLMFNKELEESDIPEEERKTLRDNFAKELDAQLQAEAEEVNKLKERVEAGETPLFNITGGVTGFIDNPDSQAFNNIKKLIQKPLSEYDLYNDEKKIVFTRYKIGNRTIPTPAVKFRNHKESISLKGLKISETNPRLLADLVELLVEDLVRPSGDVVTPSEKQALFYEYTYPAGINFSDNDGKLVIRLGKDEILDLTDKQAATQRLESYLTDNAWFTYVKRDLPTYTAFSITNGVLNTTQEAYEPFIFQYLIPRVAFDTRTRRPMVNNGFFTFEPTDIEATIKQEAKKVVEEADEVIKQNNYDDTKNLADFLDRTKLIEARSDKAQKAKADKWIATAAVLKETYKGVRLFTEKDARDVVNSDSFASFSNATLTLYKGFDSTIKYHEAWHIFSQIYLKKADRDRLYLRASKLDGTFDYVKKVDGPGGSTPVVVTVKLSDLNPNDTNDRKILEEFIAEEFRIFAMNDGTFKTKDKKASSFRNIFEKIWALLKALFKGYTPVNVYSNLQSSGVFAEMFDALYNAKTEEDLNQFQPSIKNIEFGTLNNGLVIDEKLVIDELDMDLLSESIDGIISSTINDIILVYNKPYAAMKLFDKAGAIERLYNVNVLNALVERQKEMLKAFKDNENNWNSIKKDYHIKQIDLLKKAIDNYGNVTDVINNNSDKDSIVAYHMQNSKFKERIAQGLKDPTDIDETSTSQMNQFLSSFDKDAKGIESEKLATANAIYIIESLVEQEYSSNKKVRKNVLNELGFPKTIEFKPFWNYLMKKAGGNQNQVHLYENLVDLRAKKVSPLIDQLFDKLGDPYKVADDNKLSADLWLGITSSLNKPRVELINTVYDITKDGTTANTGKVSADYNSVKKGWTSKFYVESSPFIKQNKDRVNQLDLNAIAATFLTDPNNPSERIVNQDGIITYDLKKNTDPITFLNVIGLYMSNGFDTRNGLDLQSISYIANAIGLAQYNSLAITNPIEFLSSNTNVMVPKLVDNKVVATEYNTKTREKFKIESLAARINDLALLETEYSLEYSSQMKKVPGADNKKKSIYSMNSTLSRMVYGVNKAKDKSELDDMKGLVGYMPHLNNTKNPAIMGSFYMNSLFDNTGKKIEGAEMIQAELVGAQINIAANYAENQPERNDGLPYSQMTNDEKFVNDVQSMLSQGFIEPVRSGEKNTMNTFRPNKIIMFNAYKKKSNHLFFDTEDFILDAQGRSVTGANVFKFVHDAMMRKLEGELRRIKKINNGITKEQAAKFNIKPEDAKDFYKKNVKRFKDGGKFDWFDDILKTEAEGDGIKNTLIDTYADQLTTANTLEDLLVSKPEGIELLKKIKTEINVYFKSIAQRFKSQDYLQIYGQEVPDFLYKLATKNLTDSQKAKIGSKEAIINALMLSFAINTSFSADEAILFQLGDGLQTNHAADEYTKRVPTYNSPGIIFSTDPLSINTINKYYPKAYEQMLIDSKDPIVTKKEARLFDRVGNFAVIKDSSVASIMYKPYHDLYRRVFSERNYTEAEIDKMLYGDGDINNPGKGSIMNTWANISDADGQGFIAFDYYRQLKGNEENWTDAQEDIYQKEIRGEYISPGEIFDAFPVYKLQNAGPLATGEDIYPIQNISKFAVLPLIPSLIKNSPLEIIHKRMIQENMDYATFESGEKRAFIKGDKDSDGDDIFMPGDTSRLNEKFLSGELKFTPNPFYLEYLKNQTEVSREFKEEATLSTQFRKIFDVTLYEQGAPVDFKGTPLEWAKLTPAQKLKKSNVHTRSEAVLKSVNRLTNYMQTDLLKKMGWKEVNGELVGEAASLINFLKLKLDLQDFSEQEKAIFNSAVDKDGKMKFPDLSNSPIAPRLEKFLFAILNNKIVRVKAHGEPFVQVSNALLQYDEKPIRFKNATKKQVKLYSKFDYNDDYGTNGTRGYVIDPKGKLNSKGVRCKIALTDNYRNLFFTNYFIDGVKTDETIAVYNEDGSVDEEVSFNRLNAMIKDQAWLADDNNDKKLQITGVRIPVQGSNSTEFAQVWDFLPPSAGPIIIIPAEIVAKSGGDFDVDKLTMYIKFISKQGSLLEDTYDKPEDLKPIIKEYKEKLKALKESKLNINNALDDFRQVIKNTQERVTLSKYQKKAFNNKNNKFLLKELDKENNAKFLKKAIPEAYEIYEKQIKGVTLEEYDSIDNTLKTLYGKDSEINQIYKKLSDLNEHKNNFGLVIQNTMVDNIIRVLELPQMAFSLLLPNGTYLAKPFSDELKDKIKEADGIFDFKSSTKPGVKDRGISSSKLREYDYHKDKLIANMGGKDILGVIVKEIPANNLLNKAGALLNASFVEEEVSVLVKDKQTGKVKKEVRNLKVPVELELKHNYVTALDPNDASKEIRRISMSNLLDADKKNLIADVLSQLTNGAVDIGKDDWVTYLQGNMEAIPKILFLLEAGVPAGDIFYFVNNPITRNYIKVIGKSKSKLSAILYSDRFMVNNFVKKYTEKLVEEIYPTARFAMNTAWGRNRLLKKFLEANNLGTAFDTDVLRKTALSSQNPADKNQIAGFLQYLYIEKIIDDHDFIKDAIDVDTNPTGDNYEAQAKLDEIKKAKNLKIYDESFMSKIENESSISSVFIQQFQADLFGEKFFSFRANAKLDEFIRNLLSDPKTKRDILNRTGLKADTFPAKFKNALTLNIFNNALKLYDKTSSDYNQRPISDLFNDNAVIKSINQVINDFQNKSYLKTNTADDNYWKRGLYPIPEAAAKELNLDDFIELSLEREYIRKYSYPYSDALKQTPEFKFILNRMKKSAAQPYASMTKEELEKFTYEKFILDMALHNTYNNWAMFSSGNDTVATRLDNIIKNHQDISYKYPKFIQRFGFDTIQTQDNKNPRRNFKLVAKADISKTMAASYNRQWKDLADPVMKLAETEEKDYISNKYISDFFKKLPFFAFLQAGMDPSEFSMSNVMPNEDYTEIMTNASKKFTEEVLNTDKAYFALNNFLSLFLKNNTKGIASMFKGRGLSYKKNLLEGSDTIFKDNVDTSNFITKINQNVYLLNDSYLEYGSKVKITQNYINDFRANNPDVIYLLTNDDLSVNLNVTTPEEIAKAKVEITNRIDDIVNSGKIVLIAGDGLSAAPSMEQAVNNPAEYTNYHGGAKKYDTYWETEGKTFGVEKHTVYTTSSYDKLDQATKQKLEDRYQAAREWLGRSNLSADTYAGKLVRRDMMQAAKADGIFAISEIVAPGIKGRKGYVNKTDHPIIEGGTGYAVASGIMLNKPVYVFNQDSSYGYETGWYKWDSLQNNFVKTNTPVLTKNYAGIGSSTNETEIGRQAIRDVYANTFKATTQPSTSVKGFQGYKGGFEDTGKGTPQGDGKDKAMRVVATGAIVEFKTDKAKSSSLTTLETVGQDNAYSYEKDRYVGQSYNGVKNGKNNYGAVVMLARNGKLSGTKLSEDTKAEIKIAHNQGSEFIVGDMPGVDSQFIDYLQEIGAKFTIYHTGVTSRIKVKETTQQQAPTTNEVKGTIQLELIEDLVQQGKAKITVRRYNKQSGVYKSAKGNLYDIVSRGLVKKVGDKIVGNNVSYTLDEFGAAEGFDNWENFKKVAKYAGQDLIQGKEVYLHDIKPVSQQQTSEDTDESNTCNTSPF